MVVEIASTVPGRFVRIKIRLRHTGGIGSCGIPEHAPVSSSDIISIHLSYAACRALSFGCTKGGAISQIVSQNGGREKGGESGEYEKRGFHHDFEAVETLDVVWEVSLARVK